ncbi:phenylalanine--tRNA ligase subunit beta [Terribacillus sp. AE2B 122]|uniref:phenylalanine--tRNA ligase subunit beta n=1 Tax=Terribacillus sp. AE2B 122 TaxID=1331902 RepID=UPI001440D085|nr:phenylalanine--tRNA ligase subunit beta [Terribacillus sp. AE2B 122]VVM32842.1 Phenylalanyl-tRNA synthetase beta chain (EC 6.1.1.20) [Terribacillus sp. AE2B 122]
MYVSLNWLKQYVDIDNITPEELAEKITRSGIEVESIERVAPESTNVVVGYVESCEQHPNADKLNLCQINVGTETYQIICGAPNIAQGQKIAAALPGARLPGGVKIKKAKLRGVESHGMVCSLQELGIDEKFVPKDVTDGIFVFPEDTEVGTPVAELLNLDDVILELGLTPNRADAMSMLGVAYEVAAILGKEVNQPEETYQTSDSKAADLVSVKVEDAELNPYYGAFVIEDVTIAPSPLWMRNYLMAAGIRPINNVVDITNYVLLVYGQPLHAFDYDKVATKEIVVRSAKQGEKIQTLDDQERTLKGDEIVITNGNEPIALAGVMGGANSEVSDDTKNVLLEAAFFDARAIRRSSKHHNLRSEASARYEKGIDPNRVQRAGAYAARLLAEYAGGKVAQGIVAFDELDREEKQVKIDTASVNNRLGTTISDEEIASILTKLQFGFEQDNSQFTVFVPTRRGDISLFEDMLEEIARIYGYDNIPYTLPEGEAFAGKLTTKQYLKRQLKQYLQGAGLMETITYSLTSKKRTEMLVSPDVSEQAVFPVKLKMPMSEEHSHLRLSIIPELVNTLSYNVARKQENLGYFEFGRVFLSNEEQITEQPNETARLAGALTGTWMEQPWQQEKKPVDFYVAKGIVEGIFAQLDLGPVFQQAQVDGYHPGRTATVSLNGKVVGVVGQLHPTVQKAFDLKETYVFDLDIAYLMDQYEEVPSFRTIPRHPSVTRDIALVVDEAAHAGDIQRTIQEAGGELVQQVQIFDVYQGEHMEAGKKSIAYTVLYQDPTRTLTDEEVEASYNNIIENVKAKHDAELRS